MGIIQDCIHHIVLRRTEIKNITKKGRHLLAKREATLVTDWVWKAQRGQDHVKDNFLGWLKAINWNFTFEKLVSSTIIKAISQSQRFSSLLLPMFVSVKMDQHNITNVALWTLLPKVDWSTIKSNCWINILWIHRYQRVQFRKMRYRQPMSKFPRWFWLRLLSSWPFQSEHQWNVQT